MQWEQTHHPSGLKQICQSRKGQNKNNWVNLEKKNETIITKSQAHLYPYQLQKWVKK